MFEICAVVVSMKVVDSTTLMDSATAPTESVRFAVAVLFSSILRSLICVLEKPADDAVMVALLDWTLAPARSDASMVGCTTARPRLNVPATTPPDTPRITVFAVPLALIIVAAIAGNLVQHRLVWSAESLKPTLSKISPLSGFKRVFGKQAFAKRIVFT